MELIHFVPIRAVHDMDALASPVRTLAHSLLITVTKGGPKRPPKIRSSFPLTKPCEISPIIPATRTVYPLHRAHTYVCRHGDHSDVHPAHVHGQYGVAFRLRVR
jgi:hypothetical protein